MTLARAIRSSVVKQQQQLQQQQNDPYLMDFGLQNSNSDDFDDYGKMKDRSMHPPYDNDKDAIGNPNNSSKSNPEETYNPYGWTTVSPPRPGTITTSYGLNDTSSGRPAVVSDGDIVDWPAAASIDDDNDDAGSSRINLHRVSNENDDTEINNKDESFQVLYQNSEYKHQRDKNTSSMARSTRRVVTPNQSPPPRPASAVKTTATSAAPPSTATRERLDEAETHIQILESNVTLHKRLGQLEDDIREKDTHLQLLQQQFEQLMKHAQRQDQQLRRLQDTAQVTAPPQLPTTPTAATAATAPAEEWDAAVVTWRIPKFEKKLTTERHFFESSPFSVSWYAQFYLTVCVLEVEDTVPESRRPVAIFLKAKAAAASGQQRNGQNASAPPPQSSIFPIRLDGSKITLASNNNSNQDDYYHGAVQDLTVQVGQTQMEDISQGKGVRQFTTLGALRDFYLQDDASVVVRATVRVPRVPIYRLRTIYSK